jgi:hypothetical protein
MKNIIYLIVILALIYNSSSQQLIIKKFDNSSTKIMLNEIDSIMFQKNKLPQSIASPDTVYFGNINCKRYFADTIISITNTGDNSLMITHVELYPTSDFSFIEQPSTMMILEPHKKYDFKLRFQPKEVSELKQAVLTITSNAVNGVYHKIYLQGIRDSLDFRISQMNMNLGEVCYNSIIDTNIVIINSGDGIIDITAFQQDSVNSFSLLPGEQKDYVVSFNTGFTSGNQSKEVIFQDNCGNEKSFFVFFNVIKPNIVIDTTKFIAKIDENITKSVTFRNNSNESVTINSIEIDNNNFVLMNTDLPKTIPANNSYDFQVKYTATSIESIFANICFKGQPCNFNFSGKLIGETTKRIYLLNDDFENYSVNEFPTDGAWVKCYGIDSLGFIVDTKSKSGKKSFYIEGVSKPDIITYQVKHRINKAPDKLFVEAWIMIAQGHAGSGIFIGSSDPNSCYASVQYGNHEHYFSTFGNKEGIWPEKPAYYHGGIMQWNKLAFQFDRNSKTQKVYINDFLVYEDNCVTCNFGIVESVFLYASQTGAYIDDIKVWYYEGE